MVGALGSCEVWRGKAIWKLFQIAEALTERSGPVATLECGPEESQKALARNSPGNFKI
jgi:hypothetical protein